MPDGGSYPRRDSIPVYFSKYLFRVEGDDDFPDFGGEQLLFAPDGDASRTAVVLAATGQDGQRLRIGSDTQNGERVRSAGPAAAAEHDLGQPLASQNLEKDPGEKNVEKRLGKKCLTNNTFFSTAWPEKGTAIFRRK